MNGPHDPMLQPLVADAPAAGHVYLLAALRPIHMGGSGEQLFDLGLAHPDALVNLLSRLSSANTASTSELVACVKTLLAITRAVSSRSYVIAAARTSSSGRLAASISAMRASSSDFLVMGALEVVELQFDHGGQA